MTPRNAYSMPDADAQGSFAEAGEHDSLTFFIKVREGKLAEVSYLVFGCGGFIASASVLSLLAQNKTLDEALALSKKEILEALEGLPPHQEHCADHALYALQEAVHNYQKKEQK